MMNKKLESNPLLITLCQIFKKRFLSESTDAHECKHLSSSYFLSLTY